MGLVGQSVTRADIKRCYNPKVRYLLSGSEEKVPIRQIYSRWRNLGAK